MAKVQSDFYASWTGSRIFDLVSADYVINSQIEYIGVGTSGGAVQITLPDTTSGIVDGKKIWIRDAGSAGTNPITIIPNPSDGTSIEGLPSISIDSNNGVVILELVAGLWVKIAFASGGNSYGGFYVSENVLVTNIISANVYEDINATGVAMPLNKFTFSASPNEATYNGEADIHTLINVRATGTKVSGNASRDYRITLFNSGVEQVGYSSLTSTGTTEDVLSFNGILALKKDDILSVKIKNQTNSNDVIVRDMTFAVNEV